MWISLHMRETVALARELVGGNGITLAHDVARFHADAEAVYSYEGTHEINARGRPVDHRPERVRLSRPPDTTRSTTDATT